MKRPRIVRVLFVLLGCLILVVAVALIYDGSVLLGSGTRTATSSGDCSELQERHRSMREHEYTQIKLPFSPRYQNHCGRTWQLQYLALHRKIVSEQRDDPTQQRLAVYDAYRNGLGDRLTMSVTVFLYALLTDRAFRIKWSGAPLETAVDSPFGVQWLYEPTDDDPSLGKVEMRDYLQEGIGYEWRAINKAFGDNDLRRLVPERTRTTVLRLNQGQIWELFANPHHRQQLFELGLRPETAFGCVLNFLMHPNREAAALVRPQYDALLATPPGSLRIGLQVRFGDTVFLDRKVCGEAELQSNWSAQFERCAAELEEAYQLEARIHPVPPGQNALFFRGPPFPVNDTKSVYLLVSDCEPFRRALQRRFVAGKLITQLENSIKHIDFVDRASPVGITRSEIQGLRLAVAEFFLFGLTDLHVITRDSSFGRAAAFRSLRPHAIYSIPSIDYVRGTFIPRGGICNRHNWDQWREAVMHWIRL